MTVRQTTGFLVIRQRPGHGFGAEELALDFFASREEADGFVRDSMAGTNFSGPVYALPADGFTRTIAGGPKSSNPSEPPAAPDDPASGSGRPV